MLTCEGAAPILFTTKSEFLDVVEFLAQITLFRSVAFPYLTSAWEYIKNKQEVTMNLDENTKWIIEKTIVVGVAVLGLLGSGHLLSGKEERRIRPTGLPSPASNGLS
ncbi:hypothetical protein D3875_15920 [Deinococcus cavernae]|uniref:Uncharacterized protein n=1 Tax=Deinococcus cavernae TaxID=2320857 RepID=A0A418V9K8_9DEIO|nr:hypothetical protein D3875_15920 [Deinococcus cavernae]